MRHSILDIAIISKHSVKKFHPRSELKYLARKMNATMETAGHLSLSVIMLDLTVEDYKRKRTNDFFWAFFPGQNLPELPSLKHHIRINLMESSHLDLLDDFVADITSRVKDAKSSWARFIQGKKPGVPDPSGVFVKSPLAKLGHTVNIVILLVLTFAAMMLLEQVPPLYVKGAFIFRPIFCYTMVVFNEGAQ